MPFDRVPEFIPAVAQAHPLQTRALFREVPQGATVAEIVAGFDLPERFGLPVVHLVKGGKLALVPLDMWHKVRPKAGARVEIGYSVEGPALAILPAIVSAAAPAIAGAMFTAGGFLYSVAVAAITVVGSLLINALIPPVKQPKPEQQNYVITGIQNVENRYGIYPVVLGRHLIYPPKTARGYTETVGRDIYYRGRMTFGWGPLCLENLKIGTTPIHTFDDVEVEFLNVDQTETLARYPELAGITKAWRTGTETLTLCPDDVSEDGYNVRLNTDEAVSRFTRERTESATLDIAFPQGLVKINEDGDKKYRDRKFAFRWRPVGGAWVDAGSSIYKATTASYIRFSRTIKFPEPGEYEVEVTRLGFDSDDAGVSDDSYLSAVRSFRSGKLPSHDGIAEVAFRLRASEQLSGQVDTLNAIVHQMAPIWTGTEWTAPQPVRHPAWVFLAALRGGHLRRPVPDSRIDLDAFRAWADEEPHWTCDYVVDAEARTADVLDIICASGRARKALTDLKYSVIRDGAAGPIRQMFSPRNSWGFRGTIAFPRPIHALRCLVRSERMEWGQDEVTVYADGYDATTATEFETLEIPGVVVTASDEDEGNAWRLGRYHLAQAILRPETYEWHADWEHMRVTRGDKVQLVHDVPAIGIGAARIKAIGPDVLTDGGAVVVDGGEQLTHNGQALTQDGIALTTGLVLMVSDDEGFALDEWYDFSAGNFRVTVRAQDGTRHIFSATSPPEPGDRWVSVTGEMDPAISVGDLVFVEEMTQETMEVLVTGVYPDGDGARMTAVPAAPAVLEADQGEIPPYQPIITPDRLSAVRGPALPVVARVRSDETTMLVGVDGTVQARIGVTLEPMVTSGEVGLVQLRWRPSAGDDPWVYGAMMPAGNATYLTDPVPRGSGYAVEVRTVSATTGRSRGWVSAAADILGQGTESPPPDVTGFTAVPVEYEVQLRWDDVDVPDIAWAEIRYSATEGGEWNASILLERVPYPTRSARLFARAGTYFVKWVDWGNRRSVQAASVYVAANQIVPTNAVEIVEVSGTWLGTFEDTEVSGTDLVLTETGGVYPAEGTWTSADVVDLGAPYPVQVTPYVEASGFSVLDTMSAWPVLSALPSLAGASPDEWRVDIEVATSDDGMAFGAWQVLSGGDFVGRYFKFRARLYSLRSDVTPRVSALTFVLDMPDRVDGVEDVLVPAAGTRITYDPAFRNVPSVVVTPRDAPSGARVVISNKSRTGFDIQFFDSTGAAIAQTADWVARGYGREAAA